MISIAAFSPNPLRQEQRPICIPCSYACSVGPLLKINDLILVNEWIVFQNSMATHSRDVKVSLGLSSSASGYDEVEAMYSKCPQPGFVDARRLIELRRIGNDLPQLEKQLKDHRATGIIALSYPVEARRGPHSVSIACDPVHGFFIRDSSQPNQTWNILAADAKGSTVREALRNLDATAILGEAIVFQEKAALAPRSNSRLCAFLRKIWEWSTHDQCEWLERFGLGAWLPHHKARQGSAIPSARPPVSSPSTTSERYDEEVKAGLHGEKREAGGGKRGPGKGKKTTSSDTSIATQGDLFG